MSIIVSMSKSKSESKRENKGLSRCNKNSEVIEMLSVVKSHWETIMQYWTRRHFWDRKKKKYTRALGDTEMT